MRCCHDSENSDRHLDPDIMHRTIFIGAVDRLVTVCGFHILVAYPVGRAGINLVFQMDLSCVAIEIVGRHLLKRVGEL